MREFEFETNRNAFFLQDRVFVSVTEGEKGVSNLMKIFARRDNKPGHEVESTRMAKLYQRISKHRTNDATNQRSSSVADTCPTQASGIDTDQGKVKLGKLTNHFSNESIEKQYQAYCAQHSYRRARALVGVVIIVHLTLSATFAILEGDTKNGLDLLPRSYNSVGEYLQWIYVIIGVPIVLWKEKSSPFRRKWKRWISLEIVLLVIGLQVWLTYQATDSTVTFEEAIDERLRCSSNSSGSMDEYRNGLSVPEFLKSRNQNLYSAFVAVSSTLLTVVGSTFAVAVRLDFPHVVIVCVSTAASLVVVMTTYGIKHQVPLICAYVFPGILLALSCYYADRTSRRSFAAKLVVEQENKLLEAALIQAEEQLRNDAARDSEKLAVADGLFDTIEDNQLDATARFRNQILLESIRIPFDEIKLIKLIGRGGNGEVIQAEYLGTIVVCKRMLREQISVGTVKAFRAEIELMSCLRHPNIVQFIGASWDNCSNLCMVLEFVERGDVHGVLHSTIGSRFTWLDPLLKIAIDAAQGMLYLHSQDPPVVHRDLKSVNLLCSATFGCKVSDFGLSRRQQSIDALTTVVGTPFWLSPEVIRNEKYGAKTDVYSFGIVLTELETRKTPYHDVNETGLKVMMRVAKEGLRPTLPPNCLPERKKLIEDCLLDNPRSRPTFKQILTRLQSSVRLELVGDEEKPAIQRRALLKSQKIKRDHIALLIEEKE